MKPSSKRWPPGNNAPGCWRGGWRRCCARFPIDRVVVFGSLVHPGCFTPWSDVDIAVWGLRPEDTFRAIGVAMDADSEIAVNLVDVAACRPALLRVIEREGVPL